MPDFTKYTELARRHKMLNARIISPADICFDIRAVLKCRWGCEDFFKDSIKCHTRNTSYGDRMEMINRYTTILLIHSHDARDVSRAALAIERAAFLDGYYFAFAVRYCRLCRECIADQGKDCPNPDRVRPCDQMFAIDVFETARRLGLPCEVLQSEDDTQNRYGFVLID